MRTRLQVSRDAVGEGLGTAVAVVLVLAVTAIPLGLLHSMAPRAAPPVSAYASVAEARRATGLPLALPAYFPDYLEWPPMEVKGWTVPAPGVSITVAARATGQPVLWLDERLAPVDEAPPLPSSALVTTRDTLALAPGTTADILGYRLPSGDTGYSVVWEVGGVRMVLTASLPFEEVSRLARSMREEETR